MNLKDIQKGFLNAVLYYESTTQLFLLPLPAFSQGGPCAGLFESNEQNQLWFYDPMYELNTVAVDGTLLN